MSENHKGTRLIAPHEPELIGAKKTVAIQTEAQSRLRKSAYHELRLCVVWLPPRRSFAARARIELLPETGRSDVSP